MCSNSIDEHSTSFLARPVESTADIRYVNGETRYMKIQNPGKASGVASTLNKKELAPTYRQKNARGRGEFDIPVENETHGE